MFVDLLQGGVFESFIGAFLGVSLPDFVESGSILDDLIEASFFRIRPFAALCASAASLALRLS